ncbi:hypothetical protein ACWCWG_33515, partial [Streptomyces hirsutus]
MPLEKLLPQVGVVWVGRWEHVRVIVLPTDTMVRKLLFVPSVLPHRDTTKDAEPLVLRHEHAVLRRQPTGPIRYEPAVRLPKTSSAQVMRHIGTRGGCRRAVHVSVCRG